MRSTKAISSLSNGTTELVFGPFRGSPPRHLYVSLTDVGAGSEFSPEVHARALDRRSQSFSGGRDLMEQVVIPAGQPSNGPSHLIPIDALQDRERYVIVEVTASANEDITGYVGLI